MVRPFVRGSIEYLRPEMLVVLSVRLSVLQRDRRSYGPSRLTEGLDLFFGLRMLPATKKKLRDLIGNHAYNIQD